MAVAHDRLNRPDLALAVMAKKRALLPPDNPANDALNEAWYRYFANNGTFRVHQFLKTGARPSNLAQLQTARDEIERALQIKPDAHFGREKYQLAVMD